MQAQCIDLETRLMVDCDAAPPMVCMAWSDGESSQLYVPWEGPNPHDVFEYLLRRDDVLLINQHIFFDLGVLCADRPDLLPLVFKRLESGNIRCVKVREQLIRIALGQAKFIEEYDDGDDDDDEEDAELGAFEELDPLDQELARQQQLRNMLRAAARSAGGQQKTRFDLAAIAKRWLNITLQKEGTWRYSYELLRNVPLAKWPAEAIEYPLKDARTPVQVWGAQQGWLDQNLPGGILPGEIDANCAAWALHLMKIWGVRTCPQAVAKLRREMEEKVLWTTIGLTTAGILRVGGTKSKPKAIETKSEVQRRVSEIYESKGLAVPFTDPTKKFPNGQVKVGKKVLDDAAKLVTPEGRDYRNHPLAVLAEHKGYVKILSTYIPRYVAKGIEVPITADWNVLVESFRISCAKPNLTNPPRAGNVRVCFKARKGKLFVSSDLDQAELRSWSEVSLKMFGYSTMADAFIKGIDPHLKLGAELLKITLEEAIARYEQGDKEVEGKRQFSKEPNFGLIGGMGAKKFMERAALKGIFMTLEEAKQIIFAWKNTWTEARPYLDYFERHYSKPGTIVHPITGFIRGGCGYSDGANHMFQHLTAIAVKQALWDITKECYLPGTVLYGARPIIDMHDELFGEVDEADGHVCAMRWGKVMRMGVEKWIKKVPTKCTPVLTRRLYKGAKPVYIDDPSVEGGKRLVPSKPKIIDGKTKWVHDTGEDEEFQLAA